MLFTSNRTGLLPLSRLIVKRDGISLERGWVEAALAKLRPYSLIAEDRSAADAMRETPTMSATITDVFFIDSLGNAKVSDAA